MDKQDLEAQLLPGNEAIKCEDVPKLSCGHECYECQFDKAWIKANPIKHACATVGLMGAMFVAAVVQNEWIMMECARKST